MKLSSRVGVAGAAVAMVAGLTALPASAGIPQVDVTVTGEATCNLATGHETWTLAWTVSNTTPVLEPFALNSPAGGIGTAIDITSADQSGAWTGSVDTLVGETVLPGDSVMGTDGPVPNTTGTVTLTVGYDFYNGDASGEAVGTIELDGSCEAEPTTTTTTVESTTTTAVAADAVAARPTFTG
ncbi:hypothetical protein [Rhabdothermincola salaria]|uniref:hypothetical protein n=1 Tax=Rhabdothermincola salaria TaxID=2903142 RepID=UPI001E49B69A|nr:hypothetical protein [Rhabdothermincola salaria]MCD9625617.1 hypothetical protein [Rhabdothermincola salaria]